MLNFKECIQGWCLGPFVEGIDYFIAGLGAYLRTLCTVRRLRFILLAELMQWIKLRPPVYTFLRGGDLL